MCRELCGERRGRCLGESRGGSMDVPEEPWKPAALARRARFAKMPHHRSSGKDWKAVRLMWTSRETVSIKATIFLPLGCPAVCILHGFHWSEEPPMNATLHSRNSLNRSGSGAGSALRASRVRKRGGGEEGKSQCVFCGGGKVELREAEGWRISGSGAARRASGAEDRRPRLSGRTAPPAGPNSRGRLFAGTDGTAVFHRRIEGDEFEPFSSLIRSSDGSGQTTHNPRRVLHSGSKHRKQTP